MEVGDESKKILPLANQGSERQASRWASLAKGGLGMPGKGSVVDETSGAESTQEAL